LNQKILMLAHLSQNRPENVYKFGCYFQKGRLLLVRFTGMPCWRWSMIQVLNKVLWDLVWIPECVFIFDVNASLDGRRLNLPVEMLTHLKPAWYHTYLYIRFFPRYLYSCNTPATLPPLKQDLDRNRSFWKFEKIHPGHLTDCPTLRVAFQRLITPGDRAVQVPRQNCKYNAKSVRWCLSGHAASYLGCEMLRAIFILLHRAGSLLRSWSYRYF